MVKLKDYISDDHRRASKMLACALHAESRDIWFRAKHVWRARLSDKEIAAGAFSFLSALTPEQKMWVFEAVFQSHGMPLPPLLDPVSEASDWAAFADDEQLKATTLACYNTMSLLDQADFLRHVTARAA